MALVREVSKGGDGDLGWLRRGQVQKQLEDAFVGLKDGEVSPLVRAGPALHLFKVEERRAAGGRGFEEAKDEIREILKELRRLGKTILISSHILADLAEICTTVGILEKGRLVASGSLGSLRWSA